MYSHEALYLARRSGRYHLHPKPTISGAWGPRLSIVWRDWGEIEGDSEPEVVIDAALIPENWIVHSWSFPL